MATYHVQMECKHCRKLHMVSFRLDRGTLKGKMGVHTWHTFDDKTSQESIERCKGSNESVSSSELTNAHFQAAWKKLGGK